MARIRVQLTYILATPVLQEKKVELASMRVPVGSTTFIRNQDFVYQLGSPWLYFPTSHMNKSSRKLPRFDSRLRSGKATTRLIELASHH